MKLMHCSFDLCPILPVILNVQDQLLTIMLTLEEELAQSSWMMLHALDQSQG